MQDSPRTVLAILCGGRSQRLGTDKGLCSPLGDEPLVARAVRLLEGTFAHVLIVVRDPEQASLYASAIEAHVPKALQPKVRIVHDSWYDDIDAASPQAALTGVATALHSLSDDYLGIVAVPVDHVGVRALHLRKLIAAFDGVRPVAYADATSDLLPFPSFWPKATMQRLDGLLVAAALRVRGALYDLGAQALPSGEFEDELAFNTNTREDLDSYFGAPLFDPFKRRLHYLRFSLTEACNLSCTYCLPDGFPEWKRHKARLDVGEIETLLGGFRRLGFRKVRLTGGEPTVHPHCLETVKLARRLGYERIAMTTNGLLMSDVDRWVEAGLTHLNVSLDSLDAAKFEAVTRSREVAKVRRVIEDAAARGIDVKINTVLLRTKNGDRENIEELIDWALGLPVTLRFIELMETKLNGSFSGSERVLGTEIEPFLAARGLSKEAFDARAPDLRGPATDYVGPGHIGRIGLINPMSCNFCSKCNRLRITAKGRLKLCLFGDSDIPLDLTSEAAVALNVRNLIDRKPERHYLEDGNVGNVATFRTIGG